MTGAQAASLGVVQILAQHGEDATIDGVPARIHIDRAGGAVKSFGGQIQIQEADSVNILIEVDFGRPQVGQIITDAHGDKHTVGKNIRYLGHAWKVECSTSEAAG